MSAPSAVHMRGDDSSDEEFSRARAKARLTHGPDVERTFVDYAWCGICTRKLPEQFMQVHYDACVRRLAGVKFDHVDLYEAYLQEPHTPISGDEEDGDDRVSDDVVDDTIGDDRVSDDVDDTIGGDRVSDDVVDDTIGGDRSCDDVADLISDSPWRNEAASSSAQPRGRGERGRGRGRPKPPGHFATKRAGGARWQCSRALVRAGISVEAEAGMVDLESMDEGSSDSFKEYCRMFADMRDTPEKVSSTWDQMPIARRRAFAKSMVEKGLVGEPPVVDKY
jgi:hypothetical protein